MIIIWKLNETWPQKKNSYGHFLTALQAFKTERELHHCLTALRSFNTEKGLRCFITTLKVFNPEKRRHHCLKDFNTKKGLHHLLRTLKVLNITSVWLLKVLISKNDSVAFLYLVKLIKIAILYYAGEQLLLKVAYYIIFMIYELYLLWVPIFTAIGIYFLFGTKLSWNEEADTCSNVECVLLGRNFDFLGSFLVATALYLSVTAG